jgi:hypothetical protein
MFKPINNAGRRNELTNLPPRELKEYIEFDSAADTKYAQTHPAFGSVAHIFHQNWHGIRAAAGVLPGHKIAIPLHAPLLRVAVEELMQRLQEWRVKKIVVHGFSDICQPLIRSLRRDDYDLYLVWHGNLAQLVWEPEVDYFRLAFLEFKKGNFRHGHMIKAGMGDVIDGFFAPMLVNSAPVMSGQRIVPAFASAQATGLVASDTDIRKNAHTSLLGAARSKSLTDVFYYGNIRGLDSLISRCSRIRYLGHDAHLKRLLEIDVVINVSVIDCHPMVGLEALAAGAVDLSGPLFLDALEDHPYKKLTTITNPFDVREIASRIDIIPEISNSELQSMMADYRSRLSAISLSRYLEFLEL